ncbi:MAG TPA: GH1 family beta-glucosidase [Caldimonas sp.]|jgi:beta-glucosidase|nr:GH1 family beta-glucosidase [Caldimonas sp.]HEX2541199.1 GH1 family beta-glucosidase [Caldimonas sp.]
MSHEFPPSFLWGAATSAYQIEGSPLADGAGPSIWHRFVRTPGLVANGDTGDVACDHYRRMEEDVAIMKRLGLGAYRFSIAWGRILPEGRGRVNEGGLGFYERLVDTLLANGIQPMATLYHWDLPSALDDRGGWLNPDVADWFADYASVMYRRLDDRVKLWATLNEPWVVTDGGYLHGPLAPGHKNKFEAPIASHHLLRSHAKAVQAYRAMGRHQVGLVVNIEPKYPASQSPEDLAATRRAEAYMNRQYLDPVFLGRYPDEMREIFGEAWPAWPDADFDLIREPIDFLGINYYTRNVVRLDETQYPLKAAPVRQKQSIHTETGWEVFPQGLTDTLLWIRQQYGDIPQYVTENGAAFYDPPAAPSGRVNDPLRIDYYRAHLRAIHAAIEQGVDLRGYFAWSLLDNLEWSLGYSKRFGLVHVNFETLARTPKDSARFYADVIASKGAALYEPEPLLPHADT